MKKEISYTILILLLFSNISIFAQNKKTGLQEENIKSKVKLLKETKYRFNENDGKFEKANDFQYSKEFGYDKDGNNTLSVYYKNNGEIDSKHTLKYNSVSNLIEEISHNNDGNMSMRHLLQYTDNDKLSQKKFYNNKEELQNIILYEYNGSEILNRILYLYKAEEPKIESYQNTTLPTPKLEKQDINRKFETDLEKLNIYQSNKILDSLNKENQVFNISMIENYNDKGFLTTEVRYTKYGFYSEKKVYLYDKDDNKSSIISFGKEEKPISTGFYKYDNYRNLIEWYSLNADGKILETKKEFKYDSKKNLVETKYYNLENNLSDTKTDKYDSKGNLIESIETDSKGKKLQTSYKYTFDKKGNWLNKTEYFNNSLISITERKIEYY